jgi:diguanylate cyclase (GGDEF)-like protein/PAS domain S-box-containing protein
MQQSSPSPADQEAHRLARLRELMVLDTGAEPLFDQLVTWASEVCGAPIALISLVDADRQWFKASTGLPGVTETARELAFCAHAIGSPRLFEVPDASADARFSDNPLVTGDPRIRFYAGAPLSLPGGERVGTLCVIDRQPRVLTREQSDTLQRLAQTATNALLMRRDLIQQALTARTSHERALEASEAQHRAIVDEQSELISLASADGRLQYVNIAYARHFGMRPDQMLGRSLYDFVEPGDQTLVRDRIAWVLGTGEQIVGENRMRADNGDERWVAWTNNPQLQPDGQRWVRSVGRDISARRRAELALRSSQQFLQRTGRVAGVGGWQMDVATESITWSDETRRIHEVPADYQPTLASALAFYTPEARPQVEAAVRAAGTSGQGWDLELGLLTAAGRPIWVRTLGEVEFEAGQPVRLVGAVQDITARKTLEQRIADSERFVREVTDNLAVRIAYVDRELRHRFVNRAYCARFGLAREEILGRTRVELLGRPDEPAIVPRVAAALLGEEQRFEFDEVVAGRTMRIESRLRPDVDAEGQVRGFFATGVDVTERSRNEQALLVSTTAEVAQRQEAQRQSATLRSVTDALPVIVFAVDARLQCRFVNHAFERWHGVRREQVLGRSLFDLLDSDDAQRSRPWAERAMAGESVQFEQHYPARAGQPTLSLSFIPVRLDDGSTDGFVGVAFDITPHRQEQVRLQTLAERDALTGCLNRTGFQAWLNRLLAAGQGPDLALLYIDLDHFKLVNDTHGHATGDALLEAFAQRLVALVRPSDAVVRLGGDEFALLLAGVRDTRAAELVAAKVVDAAAQPFVLNGIQVTVGASVGVAIGADTALGDEAGPALMHRADQQLYRAKQGGRGRTASESREGGPHRREVGGPTGATPAP